MNRLIFLPLAICAAQASYVQCKTKPNIVLIMCDDMGFSDLGCYGSEINTPNINRLAENGIKFSNFKNTGRSCPSRASLLTGRYQHEAGMGWMAEADEHRPGYRGQLDKKYPTIAEVLKSAGYSTYMSGKWHVTTFGGFDRPNGSYPVERGFDRYYGCLYGGGSYYHPSPIYNDLQKVTNLPDDYYYTTALSDSAIAFVERHDTNKPMFLYVAHYAPHLPLEAPDKYIQRCMDRYKVGYDILRQKRFEKMKEYGLIPEDMDLPIFNKEFNGGRPSWEELNESQRQKWIRDMATYAAMIEVMDECIGQLIQAIDKKGMLDNTVFLFLSDNGSTSEGGFIKQLMADLSNTPYRSYKLWVFHGGISSPLIMTFGKDTHITPQKGISNQTAHIIDILPTCMALSGAKYKVAKDVKPLEGISLLPAVTKDTKTERTLYFEHQSSCAIIDGYWKLVRRDRDSHWELINLNTDPFETKDLAKDYTETVERLEAKWTEWANTHKVFPLEDKPWGKRINFYKQKNPDQDGID